VVDACVAVLRSMFGSEVVVPSPTCWDVTQWSQDQWARGSYCYAAKGSRGPSDIESLRQDLHGLVFFAGEATNMYYPGKAHGAYLSGVDAARHIESTLRPVKKNADVLLTTEPPSTSSSSSSSPSPSAAATNIPASQLALTSTTECAFCHLTAATAEVRFGERGSDLGDLVGPFKDLSEKDSHGSKSANRSVFWVHEFCALVCPEVSQDSDSGQWYNVYQAQKRGRQIGCSHCGKRGATVRHSTAVDSFFFSCLLIPSTKVKRTYSVDVVKYFDLSLIKR